MAHRIKVLHEELEPYGRTRSEFHGPDLRHEITPEGYLLIQNFETKNRTGSGVFAPGVWRWVSMSADKPEPSPVPEGTS